MKILISITLVFVMITSISVPAFAFMPHNYNFSSGADYGEVLGSPTSTDNLVPTNPMTENVRRNKDAAHFPPPYGIFSGNIPTDPSSLYHDNSPPHSGTTGNPSTSAYGANTASDIHSAGGSVSPTTGTGGFSGFDFGGMLPPTSVAAASSDITNTLPLFYDDGSIGTLQIPALNLTVKVYSGETLDNMRIGVGHFEFTSAWDGNVAIAGHNRGVPFAIGGVKDLRDGDEIIYTTKYGTRTYEVVSRKQIAETDYSDLGWSDVNMLTIITCVENVPNMRWCVVARAK